MGGGRPEPGVQTESLQLLLCPPTLLSKKQQAQEPHTTNLPVLCFGKLNTHAPKIRWLTPLLTQAV